MRWRKRCLRDGTNPSNLWSIVVGSISLLKLCQIWPYDITSSLCLEDRSQLYVNDFHYASTSVSFTWRKDYIPSIYLVCFIFSSTTRGYLSATLPMKTWKILPSDSDRLMLIMAASSYQLCLLRPQQRVHSTGHLRNLEWYLLDVILAIQDC